MPGLLIQSTSLHTQEADFNFRVYWHFPVQKFWFESRIVAQKQNANL